MAIQDFSGEGRKSALEQIGNLLTAIPQEVQKRQTKQKEDMMEQVKLYSTLREAGYSSEDATSKVNRSYRSTGFIESILSGKGGGVFNKPTGEDKAGLEREKTKADIGLTKAKTGYYAEGGPRRTIIDKMTPNQLQQRLKYLETVRDTMETQEENQNVEDEIKFINSKIQATAGFEAGKAPAAETPTAGKSEYKIGQTVRYKGKAYKISKINPDGTVVLG